MWNIMPFHLLSGHAQRWALPGQDRHALCHAWLRGPVPHFRADTGRPCGTDHFYNFVIIYVTSTYHAGHDIAKWNHMALIWPGKSEIWVNISSGNGLVPDGTKPLHELMLTYGQTVFCAIHPMSDSQEMIKISITEYAWKYHISNRSPFAIS